MMFWPMQFWNLAAFGSGSFKKHVRSCEGACEMCCHAQEKVVGALFEVLSLEVAIEKCLRTLKTIKISQWNHRTRVSHEHGVRSAACSSAIAKPEGPWICRRQVWLLSHVALTAAWTHINSEFVCAYYLLCRRCFGCNGRSGFASEKVFGRSLGCFRRFVQFVSFTSKMFGIEPLSSMRHQEPCPPPQLRKACLTLLRCAIFPCIVEEARGENIHELLTLATTVRHFGEFCCCSWASKSDDQNQNMSKGASLQAFESQTVLRCDLALLGMLGILFRAGFLTQRDTTDKA